MADLNDLAGIKALDKSNLLASIESLADQVNQSWIETQNLSLPLNYSQGVQNIVVVGMGGSTLGAHIFKSLFFKELELPLEIVNGYDLPGYVNEETLVVLVSYSGGTEEVLSALIQAASLQAKILGLTSGGKLGDVLKNNAYPAYIFNPKFNPSNQPRMGLGYSCIGLLGLMKNLGLVSVETDFLNRALNSIKSANLEFGLEKGVLSREVAKNLKDKSAIIVGAEFLAGNAHAFANQINENAKSLSAYHLIPELNHHLLEGLTNPLTLKQTTLGFFLESSLYSPKIKTRFEVTKKVLDKQSIPHQSLLLNSGDKFEDAFRALVFGSYVSFYLAIVYDLDPTPIPWVEFFKSELAKSE